jgi:putative hydrolase of the HAD superfamily
MAGVEAVTLDFYDTLVFHREGQGRGRVLMDFLSEKGFSPGSWEHRILYDVFAGHSTAYASRDPVVRGRYHVGLAERVFRSLAIPAPREEAARWAEAIWRILGPDSLALFPDVHSALTDLKQRGLRLAVLSNWQDGLGHFCEALGLAPYLDHVVCSAEVGFEKPDVRIFRHVSERLGVDPGCILHVGDRMRDDYRGGQDAGFRTLLLAREPGAEEDAEAFVRTLEDLPGRLDRM